VGERGFKNGEKVEKEDKRAGISYDMVAMDNWDSFLSAFEEDNQVVGIEGNNCRLRYRIRRVFRRTCCFSKELFNHWKAFDMAFFYINIWFCLRTHHTFWITSKYGY
jgi:IS1 family transposase